jgi:hypothetical protein
VVGESEKREVAAPWRAPPAALTPFFSLAACGPSLQQFPCARARHTPNTTPTPFPFPPHCGPAHACRSPLPRHHAADAVCQRGAGQRRQRRRRAARAAVVGGRPAPGRLLPGGPPAVHDQADQQPERPVAVRGEREGGTRTGSGASSPFCSARSPIASRWPRARKKSRRPRARGRSAFPPGGGTDAPARAAPPRQGCDLGIGPGPGAGMGVVRGGLGPCHGAEREEARSHRACGPAAHGAGVEAALACPTPPAAPLPRCGRPHGKGGVCLPHPPAH